MYDLSKKHLRAWIQMYDLPIIQHYEAGYTGDEDDR